MRDDKKTQVSEKKNDSKMEKVLLIVDIFFVMVLCFIVLMITMFFQNAGGGVDASEGYQIVPATAILVAALLAGYLIFLVKQSKKDLKEIIDLSYEDKKGD
ncbi:MAG: hypothetical protein HFG41_07050 [Coprococcus sp.]|nr:hypothetical protein [Coprococcus sp.]